LGKHNFISPELFKPEKINFITPIEFAYEAIFEKYIKQSSPEDSIGLSDGKINVNYGCYLEDLFEIRKSGVLKEFDYLIEYSFNPSPTSASIPKPFS
jgi:hypothetical protein